MPSEVLPLDISSQLAQENEDESTRNLTSLLGLNMIILEQHTLT
jgi:hypothetical protein